MNRKILVTVLALAVVLLFATVPVMAAPAQKIPFMAKQIPDPVQPPPGEDYRLWVTDGGTVHSRNRPGTGTIKIWTGTNAPPALPNYAGTTSSKIDYNINLKTGEGDIKLDMTWTLPGGTFEGNILGKLEGPPFASIYLAAYAITLHGVLHGTGAFEGQTATFDGTRPVGQPFTWTGIIIVP